MLVIPDDLTELDPESLWKWKDTIRVERQRYGRGKNPDAQQVRDWAKVEIKRINKELRRRKLPMKSPKDDRQYGPIGR